MENNIGVGLIVGLTIGTSLFVYNSDNFNKIQKTFLLICIVFPPLQWISILIILGYNSYIQSKSPQSVENKKIFDDFGEKELQIKNLKDLREQGILTENEYVEKVKTLRNHKSENQLKLTTDYRKLKTLYDDGILMEQEFNDKVEILKRRLSKYLNHTLHKKREGYDLDIGKYIEYSVELEGGRIINNIYRKISNNRYFINRKGNLEYFNSLISLLLFIDK